MSQARQSFPAQKQALRSLYAAHGLRAICKKSAKKWLHCLDKTIIGAGFYANNYVKIWKYNIGRYSQKMKGQSHEE